MAMANKQLNISESRDMIKELEKNIEIMEKEEREKELAKKTIAKTKQQSQKIITGERYTVVKPKLGIGRDEDERIYNPDLELKRKSYPAGILTYTVVIIIAVLIGYIISSFTSIPKANYIKDITRLEKDLVQIRDTIKTDQTNIAGISATSLKVSNIEGQVNGLSGRINGFKEQTDSLITQVNALNGQYGNLNTQVNGLVSAVNGLKVVVGNTTYNVTK